MHLIRSVLLLAFVLLLPGVASAQESAGVADDMPQSSAFWTAFLTVVALPFLGKAIQLAADVFFAWAKAKGVKGAAAWERAYRIADSVIGYVDAKTRAARDLALHPNSPGGRKITAEEARELQALALEAAKQWLGSGGLEQLAKEAGIAAEAAETWIKGVIESRFNVKKIAETAAAPLQLGEPTDSKESAPSPQ